MSEREAERPSAEIAALEARLEGLRRGYKLLEDAYAEKIAQHARALEDAVRGERERALTCPIQCGHCGALLTVTLMVATEDGQIGGSSSVIESPPSPAPATEYERGQCLYCEDTAEMRWPVCYTHRNKPLWDAEAPAASPEPDCTKHGGFCGHIALMQDCDPAPDPAPVRDGRICYDQHEDDTRCCACIEWPGWADPTTEPDLTITFLREVFEDPAPVAVTSDGRPCCMRPDIGAGVGANGWVYCANCKSAWKPAPVATQETPPRKALEVCRSCHAKFYESGRRRNCSVCRAGYAAPSSETPGSQE